MQDPQFIKKKKKKMKQIKKQDKNYNSVFKDIRKHCCPVEKGYTSMSAQQMQLPGVTEDMKPAALQSSKTAVLKDNQLLCKRNVFQIEELTYLLPLESYFQLTLVVISHIRN